ncbi:MAG: efflux RND transporter periplasmic adaptor subunit [Ferruginibacter sp.]
MKSIFQSSIVIVFALLSCKGKTTSSEAPASKAVSETVVFTAAQIANAGIQVGKPTVGNMRTSIKVNGVIDVPPQNMVSISFPLGGYLKSTDLLPGMRVRKGQSIAVMQDQQLIQLQQDYLIARSKQDLLQKEYERQKLLNATKTSSDKLLEQTQSDYQNLRIQVNAYREKLLMIGLNPASLNENNISRTISIVSPINGYVSAVNVNIGKYVNPSDVLFELVNPEDLHLALTVFEKDIPLVVPGQKIKAHLANNPSKEYSASVILVSKNLDANRSAIVHCHFDQANHDLLPGMFLNALLDVNAADAVLVPESAVVRLGATQYIFIETQKGTFERIAVTTGNSADGNVELTGDNVQSFINKNVVLQNAYAILMKMENKAE